MQGKREFAVEELSPMEQNLGGEAKISRTPANGSSPRTPAQPYQKQLLEQLRFSGEEAVHSLAVWARLDLEATLQLLADRTQYITGASGAAIALRDGDEIICRASSGPSAPEIGSLLQVNSGLSGESIRTREVRRCEDAATDPRVNKDSCEALGIASFAVMPLIRGGQAIGIVEIFSSVPRSFQERDILALERMGEMINTALDHVENGRTKPPSAGLEVGEIRIHTKAVSSTPETRPQTAATGSKTAAPLAPRSTDVPTPVQQTAKAYAAAAGAATSGLRQQQGATSANIQNAGASVTRSSLSAEERKAFNDNGIKTCATCGFPIADERTLCVDCEAAPAEVQGATESGGEERATQTPAFLSDLNSDDQQQGVKNWLGTHKYLLGTMGVTGSAALMLLLR